MIVDALPAGRADGTVTIPSASSTRYHLGHISAPLNDTATKTLRVRDRPSARQRIFCLPYAGAGASIFNEWAALLPRTIHVLPIQLPGREDRLSEAPYTSIAPLVRDLADVVEPLLEKPFALFGHSLGGTIAFELARELRRRDWRLPVRLFVSGCRPPHKPVVAPIARLSGDQFLAAVQERYRGIPDEVSRSREWLDLVLPILRADLTIIETYRCADEAPLACPISAFGGAEDRVVRWSELMEWRQHTAGPFDASVLPGGHFFLKESRAALLRAIAGRLDPAL